jgi:tetratricopeptide (TPR) repeat protein
MTPRRDVLALLLCVAVPAYAQSPSDKRATISRLLDALKSAPSEEIAAHLEPQIERLWLESGTPAVTLLMSRGQRELRAGAHQDAIQTFTDAITLDPDLSAAYRQRGIAKYDDGDTAGAIGDMEQTLRREPRDFVALKTLTNIAASHENWKAAYEAWQKMLDIDPKTPGGEDRLNDLRRRAFGQET